MILHNVVHFIFLHLFCLRENADKLYLIWKNILDETVNEWFSKVAPPKNNKKKFLRKRKQKYIFTNNLFYSQNCTNMFLFDALVYLLFSSYYFFSKTESIKEMIEFQCTWQYAIKLLHCTLLKHSKYCCCMLFTLYSILFHLCRFLFIADQAI